jgi:hypothetical protein
MFGGPQPPFPELLCPSWLLSGFELVQAGAAVAAGREVLRVAARPRPQTRRGHAGAVLDRVEVIVDAELGILLRCVRVLRGQQPRAAERREVILDPPQAADHTQFAPPPGSTVSERPGAHFPGPGRRAAKTAAGLGAAGLGFAFRHAARRAPQTPADEEAAMPHDAGTPSAGEAGRGQPVSDQLLHRSTAAAQQAGISPPRCTSGGIPGDCWSKPVQRENRQAFPGSVWGRGADARRADAGHSPGRPHPGRRAGPLPHRLPSRRARTQAHDHRV